MSRHIAVCSVAVGAAVLMMAATVARPAVRYIWNVSASVPLGLYRLRPIDGLVRGELVAVQPPERLAIFLADRNFLPRGVPMLKRVAALPGQTVCRSGLALSVDNVEVGQARERDGKGLPLPVWQGCHVIVDGEAFLMNPHSAVSLDGRYFGVLPAAAIIGRAEPVWVSGEG
ncbi:MULTISPECIES: S26 family signal peptidase [unclassified Bradyrhizobium]|uniref:S26 family signal peptidase n=1 Tax=unclassified Bradyrhizobium TaxID=2631580 RepID=UPI0028E8A75B|nr:MULTISPECIES: S26 family signal peptidase [unclassified Bradyrhizobium]